MPTEDIAAIKLRKRKKLWGRIALVVGLWVLVTLALRLLFDAPEPEPFDVTIAAERVRLFGLSISQTVLTTWIIMAVLLVAAVLLRIFCIPRFREKPHGIQNLLETAVESIESYTHSKAEHVNGNLPAYLFSISLLMIACAVVELFGVRAPTADITMTFALALITFFLINFYGVKRSGVKGRIKSLSVPTPFVLPLRIISDIALPVSMAFRLFGNMLGGMIVMELLYRALGGGGFGIPSAVGLYFNVFHPLIQVFIFITLTLTFISEATE